MALVMLDVDPMERAQVESAVRGIVPDLGPDRGCKRRIRERRQARVVEKSKIQEGCQEHRVDRGMNGVLHLPLDLLLVDRQIVDRSLAYFPSVLDCNVPKQRHGVPERGDHQERHDFRCGDRHRLHSPLLGERKRPRNRSSSFVAWALAIKLRYPSTPLSLLRVAPCFTRSSFIGREGPFSR